VQVALDGGLQSSDGGVLLLREIDGGLGIADRLAAAETAAPPPPDP